MSLITTKPEVSELVEEVSEDDVASDVVPVVLELCPTVPLTSTTVPAMGARRIASDTASCAWSTCAFAEVSEPWAWATCAFAEVTEA